MFEVRNPVLQGFNPDPAICKVGDTYYIATSTFEWFPGVRIHQSTNLADWQLAALPLDRVSQLDMHGVPDSGGIWAPCLSHCDGIFYLVYTIVRFYQGDYKISHNYVVTAPSIEGPWSEPTYINSGCFDPSLFHDSDGKSWYLFPQWDHRREESPADKRPVKYFSGIYCQEIDRKTLALMGDAQLIYPGTDLGMVEGPHLYKINNEYHLLTAEGGTFHNHAAGFARSKHVLGPYVSDPNGHTLKSNQQHSVLRRCGHASIAHLEDNTYVMAHLCGRPLANRGRSVLGRETALQKLTLNSDGWLELAENEIQTHPKIGLEEQKLVSNDFQDSFTTQKLDSRYQFLRKPLTEAFCNLSSREGALYLKGQEFIGSLFDQSLVAIRQQAINFEFESQLQFEPKNFLEMAGITCYYNSTKYIYLYVSANDDGSRCLDIMVCDKGSIIQPLAQRIPLPQSGNIDLKFVVSGDVCRTFYRPAGAQWIDMNCALDYSILSDEYGSENFTGAMLGLCCQDVSGTGADAFFHYLAYREV